MNTINFSTIKLQNIHQFKENTSSNSTISNPVKPDSVHFAAKAAANSPDESGKYYAMQFINDVNKDNGINASDILEKMKNLKNNEIKEFLLATDDIGFNVFVNSLRNDEVTEKLINFVSNLDDKIKKMFILAPTKWDRTNLDLALWNGSSNAAIKLIDFAKTLDPKVQRAFALQRYSDGEDRGYVGFHEALIKKCPDVASHFVDFIQGSTDPVLKTKFVLGENDKGYSAYTWAMVWDRPELSDKVLDLVKTLDPKTQNKFALRNNDYGIFDSRHGFTKFNFALQHNQPERAEKFLDFVSTLDNNTKNKFALATTKDKYTHFNYAVYQNQPEQASKFLDFVSTLDNDTKKAFIFTKNDEHQTQYELALENGHPDLAEKIVDMVSTLDDDAKREFVTSKNSFRIHTMLDLALRNESPKSASKILDIISTLDNKTKSDFVLSKDDYGYSLFDQLLEGGRCTLAEGILDLAVTLDDKKTKEEFFSDPVKKFKISICNAYGKKVSQIYSKFLEHASELIPDQVKTWKIDEDLIPGPKYLALMQN